MDGKIDLVDISNERHVRDEISDVEGRIRTELEKMMVERQMPAVKVKKGKLRGAWLSKVMHDTGQVDPDQTIEFRPVPHKKDRDWWKVMDWEVSKENGTDFVNKHVSLERIDMNHWDKYRDVLPRSYDEPLEGETAYAFRNDEGRIVGWCVGRDDKSRNYGIRFIGVVDELEGKGYGGGMLDEVKGRYQNINLKVTAFARHREMRQESDRLYKFYVRNGFRFIDGGMSWSKNAANIEEVKVGQSLTFHDEVVVSGDNVSSSRVMRMYFSELDKQGKLEESLGENGAEAARNWMKIRQEQERFYSSK